MQTRFVIAIDGPAASGKSSVARAIASRLHCSYVNSGNLYRAATVLSLQLGNGSLSPLPLLLDALASGRLSPSLTEKIFQISLSDKPLEEELTASSVNENVSSVAASPEVRAWTLSVLRSLADLDSLVMEGRDIGSAVFPETPYKFYIDADPAVREARRNAQGIGDQILKRDLLDSSRKTAPLKLADGATRIDNSYLTKEETIETLWGELLASGFPLPPNPPAK